MGEVVNLSRTSEADLVWVCNCGCQTFRLRADGESECAACETLSAGETGGWRRRLPDPTFGADMPTTEGATSCTSLGSADAAIKRVLRKADPDNLAALATIHSDGRISTWSMDTDTRSRKAWLRKRMRTAYRLMVGP